MPLKPSIFELVSAPDVRTKVPQEFRCLVDLNRLGSGLYTVLAFPGMRGNSTSIVDSKVLSKALSAVVHSSEVIVAIAHDFTREARDELALRNAICFSKSDFGWTDQSWRNIRDRH
jgi:hypothetical protein